VKIYECYVQGDLQRAFEAQERLAPLRHAFSKGVFPVVVKEAMSLIGLPAGLCRRPVIPLDEQRRDELRKILVGLVDTASQEAEFRFRR